MGKLLCRHRLSLEYLGLCTLILLEYDPITLSYTIHVLNAPNECKNKSTESLNMKLRSSESVESNLLKILRTYKEARTKYEI